MKSTHPTIPPLNALLLHRQVNRMGLWPLASDQSRQAWQDLICGYSDTATIHFVMHLDGITSEIPCKLKRISSKHLIEARFADWPTGFQAMAFVYVPVCTTYLVPAEATINLNSPEVGGEASCSCIAESKQIAWKFDPEHSILNARVCVIHEEPPPCLTAIIKPEGMQGFRGIDKLTVFLPKTSFMDYQQNESIRIPDEWGKKFNILVRTVNEFDVLGMSSSEINTFIACSSGATAIPLTSRYSSYVLALRYTKQFKMVVNENASCFLGVTRLLGQSKTRH